MRHYPYTVEEPGEVLFQQRLGSGEPLEKVNKLLFFLLKGPNVLVSGDIGALQKV